MDGWDNFFVAMAGAAVAFAGLVLVSISINLERIIQQPGLVNRSAGPLIVLFALFIASGTILVPDQRTSFYGYELLILGTVFGIVVGKLLHGLRGQARDAEAKGLSPGNSFWFRSGLCLATAGLILAAGLWLALGHENGVYFLVPAMIAGFLFAFIEAWVLLIEIDR